MREEGGVVEDGKHSAGECKLGDHKMATLAADTGKWMGESDSAYQNMVTDRNTVAEG